MTRPDAPSAELPTLAAFQDYPMLFASVEASLRQQASRVQASTQGFTGRQRVLSEFENLLHAHDSGLITLEGPPGSGVTALLAHLAATYPFAFWFHDDDARQGAAALVAQLIALHRLSVPLIPPAVPSDPAALEQFFWETAAQTTGRLVVLIDPPASNLQPPAPLPLHLPASIPPDTLIIYGCLPDTALPFSPVARMVLPQTGDELRQDQAHILEALGCPAEWVEPLINAARGNMRYLRLAHALLQHGLIDLPRLAPGLDTLHRAWWDSLDQHGQRLALLLAAAGEPLPLDLCHALSGTDPRPLLDSWQASGIAAGETGLSQGAALGHWLTRDYLTRHQGAELTQVHTEIVAAGSATLELDADVDLPEAPAVQQAGLTTPEARAYLTRQFARHAALGTRDTRAQMLPLVAQKPWIRMQERRSDHVADAAHDMAWELRTAAMLGPPLRLVRSAALTGNLVSLARTLPPDAAVAALQGAVEQFGRESGLKHITTLIDQLPDVQAKALILRRLGEACYGLRMRTSAMRLLSQALDIEEQKLPALWREQRDQLYAHMAQTVLELGDVDGALTIAERIDHIERRGMVDTQVVRWLLEHDHLSRAEQVARQIEHESLGEWAQAEVAVTLERRGHTDAARALLSHMQSETARAWAEIELACDIAAHNEDAARKRIEQLDSPNQQDRGRAQLARAFALADKDGDALDVAAQIGDVAVQVSTLLDLRLTLEGLVAMLALEQATAVIDKLPRDVRVPLVSMLAASYAALGRRDQALHVAAQLADGEERERALSRVAVSLGQHNDEDEALNIAHALSDDDERDWTLDELARIFADGGRWQEARTLCAEISTEQQQARTLADLAIARARAGDALEALRMADDITVQSEYARVLRIIAPLLVAGGHVAEAMAVARQPDTPHSQATPQVLNASQFSRYQGIVVAALAEHGDMVQARQITSTIMRPLDRARAHLAIARATAHEDHEQAFVDLGLALRGALIGRDEAFRLLEGAVSVFAALGGAPLLCKIAETLDELDSW